MLGVITRKKNFAVRAMGLRYHWDGKAFVRRPGGSEDDTAPRWHMATS